LAADAQVQGRRRRLLHTEFQPVGRGHFGDVVGIRLAGPLDRRLHFFPFPGHGRVQFLLLEQLARPDFFIGLEVVPRQQPAVQENDLVRPGKRRLPGISRLRETNGKRNPGL